ncbi:hypothetical protein B0H12DRAFT_1115168, partial [Mycena haematopus]
MLLTILFVEILTVILANALPMSGEKTSSTHAYGCVTLALMIGLALGSFSLLCKSYVTLNQASLFCISAYFVAGIPCLIRPTS